MDSEVDKYKKEAEYWCDMAHIFALVIVVMMPFVIFGIVCMLGVTIG